jgi:hypothetical protein
MRGISRTMLRTCAGLAVAAGLVAGGTGVASAATTSPTAHSTSNYGFGCNPFAREQWNLNGSNTVNVPWNGQTLTYTVTFRQFGSCLSGTLSDPNYPTTGPLRGTVNGTHVSFSFAYPSGSSQGTRFYSGTISRWGYVSGYWWDSGSDHAYGTWSLAKNARHACRYYYWWNPYRGCQVFPW